MKTTHIHLDLNTIVDFFKSLQDDICLELENADGMGKFKEDLWDRPAGGGGRTRVIENGRLLEKGGVNFSHVFGTMPDVITEKLGLPKGVHFDATGVSIVIHPESPHIPITHMNVRYFQMENGTYWFGGGIDLTPIYVVPEDAQFFHQQLKSTCDKFDAAYYPKFKEWCDKYFYIKHRKEMRGIGGIFFDHLKTENEREKVKLFDFVQAIGQTFAPTYVELMKRHEHDPYTEPQKNWQLLRRSRYVEFNLVYDKGTKFGLDTGGRIESILMSMPPLAQWVYNYQPEPGSAEALTLQNLVPKDWVGFSVE